MKKIPVFASVCLLLVCMASAYAFDSTLLIIRNRIFAESKQLQKALVDTRDIILVNSMWDSSIMTVSQLDAYFTMLGIFNTIKEEDVTEASLKYLEDWLIQIRTVNEVNIKSLNDVKTTIDPATKNRVRMMTDHLQELNAQIQAELNKIAALRKLSRPKKKRVR